MNRLRSCLAMLALAATVGASACGSDKKPVDAATDASGGDASADANLMCTYPDGGGPADGGAFNGVCPTGGCPSGSVCVVEIGGVAGGGGE